MAWNVPCCWRELMFLSRRVPLIPHVPLSGSSSGVFLRCWSCVQLGLEATQHWSSSPAKESTLPPCADWEQQRGECGCSPRGSVRPPERVQESQLAAPSYPSIHAWLSFSFMLPLPDPHRNLRKTRTPADNSVFGSADWGLSKVRRKDTCIIRKVWVKVVRKKNSPLTPSFTITWRFIKVTQHTESV